MKESGRKLPLSFCMPELVVLRVHGRPAPDLVSNKPELRRNGVNVPDLPGVPRVSLGEAALRFQDRGECSAKVSIKEGRLSLDKRLKVVKEVPRHAIDREFLKPRWLVELD